MSRIAAVFLCFLSCVLAGTAQPPLPTGLDSTLQQWKSAVAIGDVALLRALYSVNPPARVISDDGKQQLPISEETGFWSQVQSAGARDLTLKITNAQQQNGLQVVSLQLSFRSVTPKGSRQRYVVEQQAWLAEPSGWRMVASTHTQVLKMKPVGTLTKIYDPTADAKAEIAAAVKKAAAAHKRVLLEFGGNWCYDCHVLNAALHEPDIAPLAAHFVIVHVDIGDEGAKNEDLAAKYHVAIDKGVPALAVLSGTGALLYSDQHGEFEKSRSMDPDDVIAFLKRWASR